jgi:hypothetical protein
LRVQPLTYFYNPKSTVAGVERIYQSEGGGREMAAHDELDEAKITAHNALSLPRVPEPADESDVMREQLEYLIDHASERGTCGCSDCQRYLRVRSLLLAIFSEPEPQPAQQQPAQQLTTLPMAA